MKKRLTLLCMALLPLAGCMTASQHNNQLGSADEERLTVAAVQREIQLGMSGAAVLAALGSPNIGCNTLKHPFNTTSLSPASPSRARGRASMAGE